MTATNHERMAELPSKFQALRASLITVTGSAEDATKQFTAINAYAGLRVLAGKLNRRRRSHQVRGTRARNYTRARARERSSL